MNKQAFFEGYLNKKKLYEVLDRFSNDPTLRIASYAPETLGVLGAGLGALVGNRLSKEEDDSPEEKDRLEATGIILGSTVGGVGGSFLGKALKNRIKWNEIRKAVNQL
jgi:hypothetical protein